MSKYQLNKEKARQEAIEWSNKEPETMSWGEVCDMCDYFAKLGRRYGLIKEFKENAIL